MNFEGIDLHPKDDLRCLIYRKLVTGTLSESSSGTYGNKLLENCYKLSKTECKRSKSVSHDLSSNVAGDIIRLSLINNHKFDSCLGYPRIQISFMLDSGFTKRDCKGETQLHKACRNGKLESVKKYLENGIDVNTQDFAGWTALHEAVLAGQTEIVKILLHHGALVNVPGLNYTTPLHTAVQGKHVAIVKLLMEHGADPSSLTKDGTTPVDLCYDDEMRVAVCLTNTLSITRRTYMVPSGKVFLVNTNEEFVKACNHSNFTTASESDLHMGDVSYFVTGNKMADIPLLQMAMLQGACIVTTEWTKNFISDGQVQNPLDYLADLASFSSRNAAMNKFNKLPKLFHGLHFYFSSFKPQEINGHKYSVKLLKQLVDLGGGTVITRMPTLESTQESCFAFHASKLSATKRTAYYFIHDEHQIKQPGRNYSRLEVEHKSVGWLIKCIDNFSIED